MTGILSMLIGQIYGGSTPVITDPYFEYTTLLLPGNGTNGAQNNTFLDSGTANSGSGFTITRNGNTTQGTFSPFSQTGWGNYFNGSTSLVTTSSPSSAANFTMEAWVYRTAATLGVVIGYGSETTGRVFMYLTSGGGLTVSIYGVGDTTFGGSIPLNQWTHVAIVRASNIITGYIDGTAQATTVTNSSTLGNTGGFGIGAGQNASNKFTGYISNARVVDGVAVYTGNFTVPTSALTATQSAGTNISAITTGQTKLLTCQSNRFVDNGQGNTGNTGYPISTVGSPSVQAFSPFNPTSSWSATTNGGSGYFDGSVDYLSVADNAALQFSSTTVFTLEAWIYPASVSSQQGIISKRGSSGTQEWGLFISSTGKAMFGGNNNNLIGTTTISTNSWSHIAASSDGTTVSIYLNGTREGTVAASTLGITTSTNAVLLGYQTTSANPFTGYMASARVVKGTQVYSGTSYTVPTAPLTAITNTSLLLNFTNAGIYDATSKNDLETVDNAQISTTQSKWGGSSMAFDGTGDYLQATDTELLEFGSGDFTIETWVRFAALPSSGAYQTLISKFDNSTQKSYSFYVYNNAGTYQLYFTYTTNGSTNVNPVANGITVTTNTWYHYAVCRSGANLRMFIDGTQVGSTYNISTDSIFGGTYPVQVGASTASNVLNGFLQDTRVTKGYARYTANFTAPTAAFPTL